MRTLLIANLAAGGTSRQRIAQLQQTARLLGHALDTALPATPAEARLVAQRGIALGYNRILAAGGDGTINLIASLLADTPTTLGVIPMGTVNVLARELNIPLDPMQALRIALESPAHRVDLGLANARPFLLMAGMGFDACVVAEIVPRWKELFGPLSYITAGLHQLTRYRPSLYHLNVDGQSLSLPAWLIVVGNARHYAYDLPMAPSARMDDGLLDVCIFSEHTIIDRVTQIGAVFAGQHLKHGHVTSFRTRSLSVSADPPVHLQLDGDAAGFSPVSFSIRPGAVRVAAPQTR